MGLKSDLDFLRNVSMGAIAAALVMRDLAARGFSPIELERACTSNKMWKTRFRRQRVPDLMCVKSGIRFEVRGKGALCIRMSDAANRPERAWDAGLRGRDVVAIVHIDEQGGAMPAAPTPTYFRVADLRASHRGTRASGMKAHAHGAESSIEWPCTVPRASGRVAEVGERFIAARLDDGTVRRYRLDGKHPYVARGDSFIGGATIIAGIVARTASPAALLRATWQPVAALGSRAALDRLCAAKAIPHLPSGRARAAAALERALVREGDARVSLEMAGALARLGSPAGLDALVRAVAPGAAAEVMLEAVLILADLRSARAGDALQAIAADRRFHGLEVRQAAVWGLGRHGCADYRKLVDFIADEDEQVALHALCALSPQADACADELIARMASADQHGAAAYSAALERIGTAAVLERLVRAWTGGGGNPWIPVTVARMPEAMVRRALGGHALMAIIEPLLMFRSPAGNWLARADTIRDLQLLERQTVFA